MRGAIFLSVSILALGVANAQPRLGFSQGRYDVTEGETLVLNVQLEEASETQVRVPYYTESVSAQAERDFEMRSGDFVFAPGTTELTLELPILEDEKFEGDEGFRVLLGEPDNAQLSFKRTAQVRIFDNDPEPLGLLEDFETGELNFSSQASLSTSEIELESELALPEQGKFENVLSVPAATVLEQRLNAPLDWSEYDGLSLWYYGGATGEDVTLTLFSNRVAATPSDTWDPVWEADFDGAKGTPPDPEIWSYDLEGSGWGNSEQQYYTDAAENASLDGNGNLVITARALPESSTLTCHYGPCRYTSARLKTVDKLEFAYGRIEGRMKLPQGQGIWPAFWMLGDDFDKAGWPTSGEIDIMEFIGREPDRVHGHLHGPGYSGGAGPGDSFVSEDGFADFHTYAVNWQPEKIEWFVDDEPYLSISADEVNGDWVFDHPFFILLNLAVGGSWPGMPDETTEFPVELVVDYLKVYALPDTSAHYQVSFSDTAEGWQKLELPFDALSLDSSRTAQQKLELSDIWGYSLSVPAATYIDQINLLPAQ